MSRKKATEELTPKSLTTLLNKRFGNDAIVLGNHKSLEVKRIPCSILGIDWLLGGGFARGRHIEIFGDFSVGKTFVSLRLIANAQKMKLGTAYVDCENTFDPEWSAHIGIDLKKLYLHKQKTGHIAVDVMETLIRSRLYGVIVLDSIAALLPKQEAEAAMEAGSMGTEQAKLMSKALRKLTTANHDTVLVYLNQTRESVSSIFRNRITSGGRAMGFYAGTRLEMTKTETLKAKRRTIDEHGNEKIKEVPIGHRARVRVNKDKVGGLAVGTEASLVFSYSQKKMDDLEDLIFMGRTLGMIHKQANKWFVEGHQKQSQIGRPKFKKWLKENPKMRQGLLEQVQQKIYA